MEDELVTRRNIYIALEDDDHVWDEQDIIKLENLHRSGLTIQELSKEFNRPLKEISIALLDRVVDWEWENHLRIRAKRAPRSKSRLDKEAYLELKRCGMTDAQIAAQERMGPGTLVERKKKWGLHQTRGGNPRLKRFELLNRGEHG